MKPFIGKFDASMGKAAVIGTMYGGTINQGEGKKCDRLWVDVPFPPRHPVVGRDAVLAELRTRLCRTDGIAAVSALGGLPGVGKTTVAIRFAWDDETRQHFRGGVLWAGLGPKSGADNALVRWGDALRVDLSKEPDAGSRAKRLSLALLERTQGEPVLLVFDDAWTWEQIEPFTKIAFPGCAHLLTTRDAGLARRFADQETRVETLSDDEAEDFVARRCPRAREADSEGLRSLVRAVGGLPLGLTLVAEELRRNEGQDLWVRKAIERLQAAEARLALQAPEGRPGLEAVPLSLQACVELSVEALGPEGEAAFTALGAFAPKPADFGRDAVLAVWEVEEKQGDARLQVLIQRRLLDVAGEGRLALHQVLANVAAARLGEERRAMERHAEFYRALMEADPEDWQRIERELEQIRWAWSWLTRTGDTATRALAYVYAIRIFHERRGFPDERRAWLERGLEAARFLKQTRDEAAMFDGIGLLHSDLDANAPALECYAKARSNFYAAGDRAGEGKACCHIGLAHRALGHKEIALEYCEQALSICNEVGDAAGQAEALFAIGWVHYDIGDMTRAVEQCERALSIFQKIGDRKGEARALSGIGAIHSALGDDAPVSEYFERALSIHREIGDRAREASVTANIAQRRWNGSGLAKASLFAVLSLLALTLLLVAEIVPSHVYTYAVFSIIIFALALIMARWGSFKEAITHMERAVELEEAVRRRSVPQYGADLADKRRRRTAILLAALGLVFHSTFSLLVLAGVVPSHVFWYELFSILVLVMVGVGWLISKRRP